MLREALYPKIDSVHDGSAAPEPWRILYLNGELDCAQAETVRAMVDETLGRPRPDGPGRPRIALDLSGVSFCDSYGLSVLVYAAKRVRSRGGVLLLAGASSQVRALIERCGLQRLLTLAPDPGDGSAAGSGPDPGAVPGS
ncbi:STAS domain-containing protein [Spirillospora sp. NBC_01491]|uniref:STAS domain-containing protein n=1 Tax=Spirillospora sp. NBC_01491 TaxID=2976007 RepID=UPI002E36F5CB|nr:STAS domain-containing protein [Spirillospora sp. NBC_01491]